MKEIKDVEQKLRNDPRRLNAYLKYQKYEAMLKQYMQPKESKIEIVKNITAPFRRAGKIAEENNFTLEEYEAFCDKVDKLTKQNPKIKLNDLSSREGRNIIGNIISETQNDKDFKVADLSGVAIAKCYGLYNAVNEAQGKGKDEIVNILRDNQVPIPMYQKACENLENYNRNNRRQLYDRVKKEKSQDIVHMAAAALEIGPGEAESSLSTFDVIEGNFYETEFDKNIRIRKDEVSRAVLDAIIMNDKLTDEQKKEMIDKEQNKIDEKNKFIEAEIQQWLNRGRDVRDMPEDFMERNGIKIITQDDEREIG